MSHAEKPADRSGLRRSTFLKMGAAGAAALAVGTTGEAVVAGLRQQGLFSANGVFDAASTCAGRPDLHRGVPDQPADPEAVHATR